MLLSTTATAPSCQLVPSMKNSRPAKNEPEKAYAAMCHFLRLDRSTNAPTIGSSEGAGIVAKLIR